MGYSTDFTGAFEVTPPLKAEHREYLMAFKETRRMKRKASLTEKLPDPRRIAAGLKIGKEGEFFVGDSTDFGQNHTEDVVAYNDPPSSQPGLWCQWEPNEDGTAIYWDGGEKFYNYIEWIEYQVEKFFRPWGYTLNGAIEWQGEESSDMGRIVIENNKVRTQSAIITWKDEAHS
jgi:hypothetical protein